MNLKWRFFILAGAALLILLGPLGCGAKKRTQVGTLKEWVVGGWERSDEAIVWNFSADGEVLTTGRLPISGSYVVEEPNRVQVRISGAGAITAGMQLGLPVDENKNLIINFEVKDDQMRPLGIKSTVVFKKT